MKHKGRFIRSLLFLFAAVPLFAQSPYLSAHMITTLSASGAPYCTPWIDSGYKAPVTWDASTTGGYIEIFPDTKYQIVYGFGFTFTELAWAPITKLSPAGQDSVVKAFFDTSGCNMNFGRIPVGNCDYDFAVPPYSLDDVSGDTLMTQFSMARDSARRIPLIKAAQKYQPNMRFWASPWSPPGWFKTNNSYSGTNGTTGNFISNPTNCRAYALYLDKFVQGYAAAGINVESITCQNEPDQTGHGYPQCGWGSVTQEDTFYRNYMIPQFLKDSLKTGVYIGVQCCKDNNWVLPFFQDSGVGPYVNWTSHSYESTNDGPSFVADKPGIPFMQSESMWNPSGETWSVGTTLFSNIQQFMHESTSVYMMWCCVGHVSGQNGGYTNSLGAQPQMVTIDTTKNPAPVVYSPEFYACKHYSHFLRPGAHFLQPVNHGISFTHSAFVNPNGDLIYVSEGGTSDTGVIIKVGTQAYSFRIPANSMNTIVIPTSTPIVGVLPNTQPEKSTAPALGSMWISNSVLHFSIPAAMKARQLDLALCNLQGRTVWTGRFSGSALQGSQSVAIRSAQSNLHAGTYLLNVKIRNAVGSVSAYERKLAVVN